MNKIFVLNQITRVNYHETLCRDDLYIWKKKVKKRFFRSPIISYCWDNGYGSILDKYSTDEELLDYFKNIVGREDIFIKDKVLYQKPKVVIHFSDGSKISKVYEDDRLAEYYYTTLLGDLSINNIPYRNSSVD